MKAKNISKKIVVYLIISMVLFMEPLHAILLKPITPPIVLTISAEAATVYYPSCSSKYTSIVDALNSIGVNSSYSNRKSIAQLNGISNYTGTAAQNTKLLTLLKQGKLIKSITNDNGGGSQDIPNGWFMIISGNSDDRVLDINNWNRNNGGNLETYTKNNTTNQRFQMINLNNGYYAIKALHSGRYLHIQDERNKTSNVHQWEGYNHNNAQWALKAAGNGYYYLQNRGNGSFLDNSGGSTALGNNVITYPYNGSNAQKWKFVSTNDESDEKSCLPDGWYEVQSANNNSYVWDINAGTNNGMDNGANLEIYQRHGGNNQKFYIKYLNNGYYAIKAGHSNKYLHKQNAGYTDNVVQWASYSTSAIQTQWAISSAGSGYYYVRAKAGNYVDNSNAAVKNGNNVITYMRNGSNAQKWKFVKCNAPGSNSGNNNNTNSGTTGTYASYSGIDYTKQTTDSRRIAALQKAQRMVTIRWVCPADFVTWSSSKGGYNSVTAEDGTISTKFIKGKTYVGIPYSMINHSYDETSWISLVKSGFKNVSMEGKYDNYPKKGTAKGSDCSYFVYLSLKAGGANITYQNTSSMISNTKRYYKKINKSEMKPGDILLKSGHVMLFVGKSGTNYAVFEATAAGSKTRYKVYTESDIKSYSAYKYANW